MRVSKKQQTAAASLLLVIITLFGFAGVLVRFSLLPPDAAYRPQAGQAGMPDTSLNQRKPQPDSVFRSYVATADNLIQQSKYDEALPFLEKALSIRPTDVALKNRVTQVKAMAAQQKKDNEEYARLIVSADNYFKAKAYLDAKATYQMALNLKPDDQYAQGKLNETMGFLRSQKAQNILYDVAVANADKFYEAGDLDKAKAEYEKATQILPGDQYAKDRMNEIIKIQVDKQVREELYAQAITKADQLSNLKKYQGALTEYKNALKQKPLEKYPQDRVKELTELLNQAKALEEAYQKALASADQFFVARRYPEARNGYQDALKIKPNEIYPKNRIAEIDKLLADLQLTAIQYDKYITLADSLYIGKEFVRARQNYQLALQIKPNEAYPKEMISKTEQGMTAIELSQKTLDENYASAVASADKLLLERSYEEARKEYQRALSQKPAETYPKSKIAEIDKALAALLKQKSLDDQYASVVANADKSFGERDYDAAKASYLEASALKPAEDYPKSQIAVIDGIFEVAAAKEKENDDRYKSYIAEADRLFTAKLYEDSRKVYQDALTLKPGEKYPQDRLAQITGIIADIATQKELDRKYDSVIAIADQKLAALIYDEAKNRYKDASGLKPSESYPKKKIAEIDATLAAAAKQRSVDEQYAGTIAEADKLFGEKSYDPAKAKYQSASALKPSEEYPRTKIAEIDALFASEAARVKEINDRYAAALANGARLLSEKSYEPAKTEYLNASEIKPDEQLPKDKIKEIDAILADLAAKKSVDDRYAAAIADADRLLASESYDEATTKYTEASGLKPAESYPKTKIAEIDATRAAVAKQKLLDDQYKATVADADRLFTEKSYKPSRARYQDALSLKPAEEYPKTKIAEIDALLAAEAAMIKDINDRYAATMANAANLLAGKSYDPAKAEYMKASDIKPEEQLPKDKIKEIDAILADIAAKQKLLDDQYNATIADADRLLGEKSYEPSKAKYQAASALKPAEEYPKTKIAEIDALLAAEAAMVKDINDRYAATMANAAKLLAGKSWDPAKAEYMKASAILPDEQLPKDKIKEIDAILADLAAKKALDDQYAAAVAEADKLLGLKNYAEARTKYTEASDLKPAETYPKTKIAEIDATLAVLAKQKLLDDQYNAAIADADKDFGEKSYETAKTKYQAASALKPAEEYPKTKITEIGTLLAAEAARVKDINDRYNAVMANAGKLLADKSYDPAKAEYMKASSIKPEEQLPKDKVKEIEAILADIAAKQKLLDDQYNAAIAEGDRMFGEKTYETAKTKYQEASALKPAEQYPKAKIAETDKMIAEMARLKAIDDQYAGIIAKADQLLSAKSYPEAKTEYQNALKVKPSEQYPKDKIGEIDAALAELAKQKSIGDRYRTQVTKADQLFNTKQYEPARAEYLIAEGIKGDEQYPKDRIAEIDNILAEAKARDDSYKATITRADQLLASKTYEEARTEYQNAGAIKPLEQYPKDKISEINRILTELQGKKVTYDNLLKSAGDFLTGKEYNKSKEQYQQASGIFPEEAFPKERIAWITRTVDSIYRVNKADYDRAVANGDKFYTSFEFDKAIDAYTEASGYLPMESYPKEQIAKIRRTISENAIVDVLKTPVTIPAGDERRFSFEPVNIASRKDNFVYLKIRNLSDKPFNILMRYGRDAQSNGGVVIRNVSTDGKVNERLISVRDQDLWYRADNNWISLFPQGGDIEVSFIQVSKVR